MRLPSVVAARFGLRFRHFSLRFWHFSLSGFRID
jgi:hypothetical protein